MNYLAGVIGVLFAIAMIANSVNENQEFRKFRLLQVYIQLFGERGAHGLLMLLGSIVFIFSLMLFF